MKTGITHRSMHNYLLRAITFNPTVIFKIHTFLETGSQNLSRGVKINPIHGVLEVAALRLERRAKAIKGPRHPLDKKKRGLPWFCSLPERLLHVFPLFQKQKHIKVMDIRSKPTFVPREHHLLFAFLLVCLLACLLISLYLCLPCLSQLSALCLLICTLHLFLPLLICWFLVFTFACTHIKRGHMELGHGLPSASKKGVDASM